MTYGYLISVQELGSTAQSFFHQGQDLNYGRSHRTFCLRELPEYLLDLHSRFLQPYHEQGIPYNN